MINLAPVFLPRMLFFAEPGHRPQTCLIAGDERVNPLAITGCHPRDLVVLRTERLRAAVGGVLADDVAHALRRGVQELIVCLSAADAFEKAVARRRIVALRRSLQRVPEVNAAIRAGRLQLHAWLDDRVDREVLYYDAARRRFLPQRRPMWL